MLAGCSASPGGVPARSAGPAPPAADLQLAGGGGRRQLVGRAGRKSFVPAAEPGDGALPSGRGGRASTWIRCAARLYHQVMRPSTCRPDRSLTSGRRHTPRIVFKTQRSTGRPAGGDRCWSDLPCMSRERISENGWQTELWNT